jgi:hypothetical protein
MNERIWEPVGAHHPRDCGSSAGKTHVMLRVDFDRGRLHRKKGDALCRPRSKFWELSAGREGQAPNCARCIELGKRLGLLEES